MSRTWSQARGGVKSLTGASQIWIAVSGNRAVPGVGRRVGRNDH